MVLFLVPLYTVLSKDFFNLIWLNHCYCICILVLTGYWYWRSNYWWYKNQEYTDHREKDSFRLQVKKEKKAINKPLSSGKALSAEMRRGSNASSRLTRTPLSLDASSSVSNGVKSIKLLLSLFSTAFSTFRFVPARHKNALYLYFINRITYSNKLRE